MAELSQLNVKITGDNTSLNTAVSQSMKLVDQFGREVTNSHKQAESAAASLTNEYRSLRASIDPLYANSKKYERQLAKLNALQKAGRISAGEFSRMNAQLSGSLIGAGNAVEIFNGQVRVSRFHTSNLAAQFNDIGVMLAAGQSPLILAMQQGTQISQVFGAMGGTMKENFSAIGQGLKQMASPMALLTIGSIAAGAALFQWGRKALTASEEGQTYKEILEEINEELRVGEERISQYNQGFNQQKSVRVQEKIVELQDQIAEKQQFINALNEQYGDSVNSPVASHEEVLRILQAQLAEQQKLLESYEQLPEAEDKAKEASERRLEVQQRLADLLNDTDASVLSNSLEIVKQQFNDLIAQVEPFLDKLAAREAVRTGSVGPDAARQGISDEFTPSGLRRDDIVSRVSIEADDPDEDKKPSGGRGGSRADQGAQELERLQTQLMSELELEQENFVQRQSILDESLEKQRLSREEHAALTEKIEQDHADKMRAIDRAVWHSKLDGWAGAFGDLATLAQSENEKLAKIGRVAGMIQIGIEGVRSASSAFQKGMEIGGPPTAYAFAAMSVAKTAALLSQMRSSAPNPAAGGGGGAATSGGQVTAPEQSQPTQRNFEFILIGDSFGRAQVEQVLRASIDAQDDGNLSVNIRGRR